MDLGYFSNGAELAADLVNTFGPVSKTEDLGTVAAVQAFLAEHGQQRRVSKADLPRLHALRTRLRAVFTAANDEQARRRINDLLADFPAQPRLGSDPDGGVVFEGSAGDAVSWIGATSALGLAFFVAEHGTARLGICGASDCLDAFVDGSKNSTKHYCSTKCTRLENVRAFRARKRASK